MEELENKYIRLLLTRCLNFKTSKSLLIHCNLKEHLEFASKVKQVAQEMGITDICIHLNDLDEIHDYLKNTDLENIELNPIIDKSAWDDYAQKEASILFLDSNVPGLMKDIEPAKIDRMYELVAPTIAFYRMMVGKDAFPWCIAALPNERWAKSVFGDTNDAYQKLYLYIFKMCMVDTIDPLLAWEEFINNNNQLKDRLNQLEIKKMRYRNSLGTDLTVGFSGKNNWLNLDKVSGNGGKIIVNMPSYEIFTTPDCRLTEGVVYSSRPLIYSGTIIDEFYLEFHKGKVINCDAKVGVDMLRQLVFKTKNANLLGEVALVPYDSPISNTGLVFNNTLFDENASCHLALGNGYAKCFPKFISKEELENLGVNSSIVHVDFMIGTSDLEIEAETSYGRRLIFKDGNFNL